MRDHAVVSPLFWSGETGQQLRKDPDAQRLALYLMTCPNSNMIGLYYLPIPTACHELGMTDEQVRKALRRGFEVGFCDYDEVSEVIFVYKMALFQCAKTISERDKRKPAVERLLKSHRKCRFYKEFLRIYGVAYGLKTDDAGSPSEGGSVQEQDKEQDQEYKSGIDSNDQPNKSPTLDQINRHEANGFKATIFPEIFKAIVETYPDKSPPKGAEIVWRIIVTSKDTAQKISNAVIAWSAYWRSKNLYGLRPLKAFLEERYWERLPEPPADKKSNKTDDQPVLSKDELHRRAMDQLEKLKKIGADA